MLMLEFDETSQRRTLMGEYDRNIDEFDRKMMTTTNINHEVLKQKQACKNSSGSQLCKLFFKRSIWIDGKPIVWDSSCTIVPVQR